MADMTPPSNALCVLGCRSGSGHPYPVDNGYVTCNRCADRLRDVLDELVTNYATIAADEALLPAVSESASGKPVFGPRSPADDYVIALRDPRTTRVDPADPHSPLAILAAWAGYVRTERHLTPPHPLTVVSEAGTLRFHWDWIMRQEWVADMAKELREVHSQLKYAATREPRPQPVGTCIRILDTDNPDDLVYCGAKLYLPRAGKTITCRVCQETYDAENLIHLRVVNMQQERKEQAG